MSAQTPTFVANFTRHFPLEKEEYEQKKRISTMMMTKDKDTVLLNAFIQALQLFMGKYHYDDKKLVEKLKISPNTLGYYKTLVTRKEKRRKKKEK